MMRKVDNWTWWVCSFRRTWWFSFHILLFVGVLYILFVTFEVPFAFTSITGHQRSFAWRLAALGAHGEGLRWPVGCAAVAAKGPFMMAGRKGGGLLFISGLRLIGGVDGEVASELEKSLMEKTSLG